MKESADPNSDKIKAEFRQKLEHFEAAPSSNLWDRIDLSLEKEEALAYKNRMRLYARLAAACLLLLIAFSAVFIPIKLNSFKTEEPEIALKSENPAPQIGNSGKAPVAHSDLKNSANETQKLTVKPFEKIAANTAIKRTIIAKTGTSETVGKWQPKATRFALAYPETTKPQKDHPARNAAISKGFEHAGHTKNDAISASIMAAAENTSSSGRDLYAANIPEVEGSSKTAKENQETQESSAVQTRSSEINLFLPEAAEILAQHYQKNSANGIASGFKSNLQNQFKEGKAFVGTKKAEVPQAALENHLRITEIPFEVMVSAVKAGNEQESAQKKIPVRSSRWAIRMVYGASAFKPGMALAKPQMEVVQEDTVIGLVISPVMKNSDNDYQDAIDEFNRNTYAAFSNRLAFLADFKISQRISVQSGLQLAQNSAKTTSTHLIPGFRDIKGSAHFSALVVAGPSQETILQSVMHQNYYGNEPVLKTENFQTEYRYYYLGVPVNLRYQVGGEAAYGFIAAGFSVNRLIRAETRNKHPEFRNVYAEQDVYRNWLPALQLQAGAGYPLSDNWHAEVAVEGIRFLAPLLQNEQIAGAEQKMPINLGGTVGLVRSF
jgi:hypothetical protein